MKETTMFNTNGNLSLQVVNSYSLHNFDSEDSAIKTLGLGDFNGDGSDDILFSTSTDQLIAWSMKDNKPTLLAVC